MTLRPTRRLETSGGSGMPRACAWRVTETHQHPAALGGMHRAADQNGSDSQTCVSVLSLAERPFIAQTANGPRGRAAAARARPAVRATPLLQDAGAYEPCAWALTVGPWLIWGVCDRRTASKSYRRRSRSSRSSWSIATSYRQSPTAARRHRIDWRSCRWRTMSSSARTARCGSAETRICGGSLSSDERLNTIWPRWNRLRPLSSGSRPPLRSFLQNQLGRPCR